MHIGQEVTTANDYIIPMIAKHMAKVATMIATMGLSFTMSIACPLIIANF